MPATTPAPRSYRDIFRLWYPMAGTWFLMAIEGPFLAAIVARLPDERANLAAYGVAYAIALIAESPVIMMLSASTALVDGRASYRSLRRFNVALSAGVTAVLAAVVLTPLFGMMTAVLGLPADVAALVRGALLILLPWPAAIGYRRFFQGLLIRRGRTGLVWWGTVVRLVAMATTAAALFVHGAAAGAFVGAAALSAGVVAEAVAGRVMARTTVRAIATSPEGPPLPLARIATFYTPLALTSLIGLAAHPTVTFFVGRARFPLESLAVIPVIHSLTFVFRSVGLSFQEVAIALLSERSTPTHRIVRFAAVLGIGASAGLGVIAFTPLAAVWFEDVSDLTRELAAFAVVPTRLLVVLPAMSVLLSLQRALLVHARDTVAVTRATAVELAGIVATLAVAIHAAGMVGAVAASVAVLAGRTAANVLLARPSVRAARGVTPAA